MNSYGIKKNEDRDDLIQEVCLVVLRVGKLRRNIQYLLIDACRKVYYDQRTVKGMAEHFTIEPFSDVIPDSKVKDMDKEIEIRRFMEELKGECRVIYGLLYLWGFDQKEVAYLFEASEAWVTLRKKEIFLKLGKKIKG